MYVEIPRPGDATELNNDSMIKLGDVYYQTEQILTFFSKKRLNQRQLIYLRILSATAIIDLRCHVFAFEKHLLNVRLCL